MRHWGAVHKCAWILLALLAIVGLLCVFLPRYGAFRKMRKQQTEDKAENRRIEFRIAELCVNQDKFLTDPAFVEGAARENGRVKPNEVVYRHTNRQSRIESP
ncbi:MAG: hypothetical protein QME60_07900 [Verrucomicrobiota bacterium]|nr:hypothetical protein [Verrucomicrobiota bacterium]